MIGALTVTVCVVAMAAHERISNKICCYKEKENETDGKKSVHL